jgi:hypothetical protein
MFTGRSEENILAWRDFRNQLTTWPGDIETVAKAWALAPLSKSYLAFDDTLKWPDAWSLVSGGIYCDISVALGMFYTLYYSSYEHKSTMQIRHYHIRSQHQTLNLVSLEDGKYMLNYHQGRSVNILELEPLPAPVYTVTAQELPIKN